MRVRTKLYLKPGAMRGCESYPMGYACQPWKLKEAGCIHGDKVEKELPSNLYLPWSEG